jgi:hypothetical protein
MRWFAAFKNFMCAQETPRYILVIGFIGTLIIPKTFDVVLEKVFDGQHQRDRAVVQLVDETHEFRLLVARYVDSLIDARSKDADARRLLLENIAKQYTTLQAIEKTADKETYVMSVDYNNDLIRLRSLVSSDVDVKEMLPFWKTIQVMMEHRDAFLKALNAA